ncbi:unnamed protein product (macronuclear) [Paramecium tetraurelia]|uniref:Kinesin-like protein n=1 Tax=Paramecium tetraurelia TaxID=5888 RepID=A0DM91_PARTE|nr:uncharacterized protein GSPATT00018376001 [Paramecium tetraurelia]CAK84158.1 unnamed protein product [Paramecium tetraurelia]|eukprot:XP_001451555.1 hypothetical protein (macronuclear) [Paramecium tetraurelia strain d4-2]
MVFQVELSQQKQEIVDLSDKLKSTQQGYSTTVATSFLQTSFNQKQDSLFKDSHTLESVGQTEGEYSIMSNKNRGQKMMLKIIQDPITNIKKQKEIIKREITQWQDEFLKKEGRPPSINDKQSISTKFYQYTILKKQLNDRSTVIQDSTDCKNMHHRYINLQEQMKQKTNEIKRLSLSESESVLQSKTIEQFRQNKRYQLKVAQIARFNLQMIFNFDNCFNQQSTQKDVYEEIQQSLQAIFHGYNLCIFAYGQTGSGKTYTMFGTKQQPGVIPNLIEDIYAYIKRNNLDCSIIVNSLEIYKENIIDLLNDQQGSLSLELKENASGQVFVQNLTNIKVQNMYELMNLIEFASSKRRQSLTEMNDSSSRSHMCTQLVIETFNKITQQKFISRVNLIDLAGSERCNKSRLKQNQLEEAKYINKSLSALNDVMIALSTKSSFIPYRNSKLTYLMREFLGGNSKTIMIINISPSFINLDESMSSLQYGQKVKQITNQPIKNLEPVEQLKKLQKVCNQHDENTQLRQQK